MYRIQSQHGRTAGNSLRAVSNEEFPFSLRFNSRFRGEQLFMGLKNTILEKGMNSIERMGQDPASVSAGVTTP